MTENELLIVEEDDKEEGFTDSFVLLEDKPELSVPFSQFPSLDDFDLYQLPHSDDTVLFDITAIASIFSCSDTMFVLELYEQFESSISQIGGFASKIENILMPLQESSRQSVLSTFRQNIN